MTAVVTGARGFLGRNLVVALRRLGDVDVVAIDRSTGRDASAAALARADVVFHLAGVNRPPREQDHEPGNAGATRDLCDALRRLDRAPRVVYASSTQVARDNAYGRSKLAAERALTTWAEETGAEVVIFRLSNVFGKWCRPDYNSFVATFCHRIARGLPVAVDDPDAKVDLVYVDDVVAAFVDELAGPAEAAMLPAGAPEPRPRVTRRPGPPATRVTVGRVAALLHEIHDVRTTLVVPDLSDPFVRRLYATYLSHLDRTDLAYGPAPIVDQRGLVKELLKSRAGGQVFVSRTKPGVTRGNHFHDSKVEKFVVVEGTARIRFRHVVTGETAQVDVTGDDPSVVDVPPGYTHDITNTGAHELVTLFWASEVFDPARPDTHPEKV